MTVLDVALRFVVSVLLTGGLVCMGYVELSRHKERIVGLFTWAFAILPFSGLLMGIASLQFVPLLVRVGLMTLLVAGACVLIPRLFAKARARFR